MCMNSQTTLHMQGSLLCVRILQTKLKSLLPLHYALRTVMLNLALLLVKINIFHTTYLRNHQLISSFIFAIANFVRL